MVNEMKEYFLRFTGADWASMVNTLIYFWMLCTLIRAVVHNFKDDIKSLMSRVKKVGPASFAPKNQAKQEFKKADNNVVTSHPVVTPNSIVLNERMNGIKDELKRRDGSDEEKTELLIAHLADAQILLHFEKIYGVIFGGQIRFLKELNTVRVPGKPKSYFEKYYKALSSTDVEFFATTNFSEYMNFLLVTNLTNDVGDNYVITPTGVEFLSWLVTEGKIENKRF